MKRFFIIGLICFILIMTLSAITYAYFTTYANASGESAIETGIVELSMNYDNGAINIENVGDCDAYVRVKVIDMQEAFSMVYESGDWTWGDDGYIYYGGILTSGETIRMAELRVVNNDDQYYDKLVCYAEGVNVLYTEDGTSYADWNISVAY